jgi:signal transduction histidine kinase
LRHDSDGLALRIQDDGKGMAPTTSNGGHGLASMRPGSEVLGGEIAVVSQAGRGTTITLQVRAK